MAPSTLQPYNYPLLENNLDKDHKSSSIQQVALATKTFRVYGLRNVDAWKMAFEAKKRAERLEKGVDKLSLDDDGNNSGEKKEEEEEEEMNQIQKAIETALSDDAGGFGTAGFHKTRVTNVHLAKSSSSPDQAVYIASLLPCHPESGEPLNAWTVVANKGNEGDNDNNDASIDMHNVQFEGNDEYHIHGPSTFMGDWKTPSPFQLRVTISRAKEALAAKKYYDGLFAVGRELYQVAKNGDGAGGNKGNMTVSEFADMNGQLRKLREKVEVHQQHRNGNGVDHHGEGENNNGDEEQPLGYLVEMMLVDPHVPEDEIVIPPPDLLNKADPASRSTSPGETVFYAGTDEKKISAFDQDVCVSPQFVASGPWEKANLEAFDNIGLDLRKALVRVEFPVFPEGCKDKTFREVYQLNARLKSGSFATVCRGTHRATGRKVAIKCVLRMDLPPNDDAAIYDEVLILSTLRHRYICPLIDFFEERECYFFVMELMYGGDLFDRIGKRKNYSEEDARDLCRKMLESVRYCHENSVAHCDMKPKNLLLISDDDDVDIKLADFGFATRVYEPCSLTKQCGTPFFVAPEVLLRTPYDQQSDMWSVGVIIYLLLGGDLPFMGRSQKELFRKIVLGNFEYPDESWGHVSSEAKDLVSKMLVTDPAQRITSREALASPWMRQRGHLLAKNNLLYTSQRLKTFNARMKLRSSMIAVIGATGLRLTVDRLKRAAREEALLEADGAEEGDGDDGNDEMGSEVEDQGSA